MTEVGSHVRDSESPRPPSLSLQQSTVPTRPIMNAPMQPFRLSRKLPPKLAGVHHYWKSLIRAENTMPFSDDVDLSALKRYSDNLLLVDIIFGRFRFNYLGHKIIAKFSADIRGRFADELALHAPFNYFMAQASATLEAAAPTLYSSRPANLKKRLLAGYCRILLPAWGNGRVELLLGAIV